MMFLRLIKTEIPYFHKIHCNKVNYIYSYYENNYFYSFKRKKKKQYCFLMEHLLICNGK